jgi:hypothetical protein
VEPLGRCADEHQRPGRFQPVQLRGEVVLRRNRVDDGVVPPRQRVERARVFREDEVGRPEPPRIFLLVGRAAEHRDSAPNEAASFTAMCPRPAEAHHGDSRSRADTRLVERRVGW